MFPRLNLAGVRSHLENTLGYFDISLTEVCFKPKAALSVFLHLKSTSHGTQWNRISTQMFVLVPKLLLSAARWTKHDSRARFQCGLGYLKTPKGDILGPAIWLAWPSI